MKLTSIHAVPLAYFLEVAERGSLSAASASLHVAVSAISRQVARLEAELGAPLFEREPRGMRLTEAGLVVQQYGRRAFLDAQTLQADLQGLLSVAHSTVRLACTDGFARDYMPYAMALFQRRYPGVSFSLEVCAPAAATRMVREGLADLALTFAIAAQEGIEVVYSEAAPVYAYVARKHPLAALKRASLKEVVAYPLALPSETNTIRQLFDLACGLEGLRPRILLSSNSLSALVGYQAYADAVYLTGSLAVRNNLRAERRVLVPIASRAMQQRALQIQTMAGRHLPPAVRAFAEWLEEDIAGRRRAVPGHPARRRASVSRAASA